MALGKAVRLSIVPRILEGVSPVTRLIILLTFVPSTEELPVLKITPELGTLNLSKLWYRFPPLIVPLSTGAIAFPFTSVAVEPSTAICAFANNGLVIIAVTAKIENMPNRLALSNILGKGELLTLRLDKDIIDNSLN